MPKVGVYPPRLQQDLADHHGMWHRTPIPDLLAALDHRLDRLGRPRLDGVGR